MQDDRNEERDPRAPQKSGHGLQQRRIVIELFGSFVDLKIAEQVANDESEEDDAGDGHDGFLADGGLPKPQAAGREAYRSSHR